MHLVKHREAIDALMATPPKVSSLFTPDVAAARAVIGTALADGRAWLDPVKLAAYNLTAADVSSAMAANAASATISAMKRVFMRR